MLKKICAIIAILMLFGALCTIEQRPDLSLRLIAISAVPVYFGQLWDWKGSKK